MSDREKLYQLLDTVPDTKIAYIIGYIQGITTEGTVIPNEETVAAMRELEDGGGTVFDGSAHDFISAMLED